MEKYDVTILGGGLSGLTLALQLKQSKPELSILILEKRTSITSLAGKVGESVSELGAHYLSDVLHLKEYLSEYQLPKFGFRFFFSQNKKEHLAKMIEVGSKISDSIPAYHIDRGAFENELIKKIIAENIEIVFGATVKHLELLETGHKIRFEKESVDFWKETKWVIDSTGRRGFIKRKLDLEKDLDHKINAAWFRLESEINIEDWSEDKTWKAIYKPGQRRLSTNHLMGTGYWVWLIPLASGNTSIGIVADPSFHSFDQFNTFEKAMTWLEINEPLAAKMLGQYKKQLIDFKVMKHLAHDTKQFYSTKRWALTGDAGAFMDPFYSPGIDFIALNNSWLTELIIRDFDNKNFALSTMVFEHAHKEILKGWLLLYKNKYQLFGKPQIMIMKIVWDWGSYWAIPCLMFMNKGYTDIAILKRYSVISNSIGKKFSSLNEQMQDLFLTWGEHDFEPCSDQHLNVFDLDCLYQFYRGLTEKYNPDNLTDKLESNLKILEQMAAEIFRIASKHIHGTSSLMKVDPYTMMLHDKKAILLEKSKTKEALVVDEAIKTDLAKVWLGNSKIVKETYAK